MGMFDSMFGGGSGVDNSAAYAAYADAMRKQGDTYNPITNMGNQARGMSFDQYQRLVNNSNSVQDQIASGFSMSPYQKQMEDDVTQRMNYNAANTGMLNSGASQKALQDNLTNMTGQYENDYINRGMNSYNTGLSGYNTLSNMGFDSMGRQDNLYGQAAGADLYGTMSHNQYEAENQTDWGGMIGGLAGGAAGLYFGGPTGMSAGSQLGRSTFGNGGGGGSMFPSMNGGGYNSGGWSY
jgi:hypothetical protein